MTDGTRSEPSQRAKEVTRDLFEDLAARLREEGLEGVPLRFHLDGSDVIMLREDAERWALESVDTGFPQIRFYIEGKTGDEVMINLAAFEDADSQYWE